MNASNPYRCMNPHRIDSIGAYNLTNAPEKVSLHIHGGGHRVDNSAAYEFLTRSLDTQPPEKEYSL